MTYVWAAVGAILYTVLVFFGGYHFGGEAPKLADARTEIKTALHQQQQTGTDETVIAEEAKSYEDAQLAPLAAPVARVCYYSNAAAGVHPAAAAGSGAHASPAALGATAVPPVPGPDIGPGVMRAAAIATAQVTALQDYIGKVCLK